ncbi:MAG: heparinase II/III-family protein [Clostridia bacterium]|nr:heparinase II/III-family protein [Clostridia bacterium]
MQHPNLFCTGDDVRRFREKMKSDPAAAERYRSAVEKVEERLAEPFITWEEANGKESLHANFCLMRSQANTLLSTLGLKYLIEGDERCAVRLKELIVHYIGFERWYARSYVVREPNPWHSDLCSTGTTLALGRIYDIIRDSLTPEERHTLAEGIFEKGIGTGLGDWALPETRIHALDSMGHNWWAVCIGESATALLALQDDLPGRDCAGMLDCADRALAAFLTYGGNRLFNKTRNFDDQGMFYEGVGYDDYGVGSLLRYLWCRERCSGRNETIRAAIPAGFCDAPLTFLYPFTKDGKTELYSLDFCDNDIWNSAYGLAKSAVLLGLASAPARAYAARCGADLWEEIAGCDFSAPGCSMEELPKTAVFSSGYALTRDTWAPDGTLFAVRSGFCWNHSHNDAGSFVIFHRGKPFFTDSGTCDYSHPLYHDYYCQDRAHSVVRVGENGRRDEELYRGTRFPGAISDSYEGEGFVFFQADSTGPMAHLCSRLYRNFFWIDSRLLVIVDDVYCHEPETVQLSFHFDGTYRREKNAVRFDNGGMTAALISHLPAMTLKEKIGRGSGKPDEDKIYLELRDDEKARTHTLIHTLELDPETRRTAFRTLKTDTADGILIIDGETEREIWYNHLADGHVMHDNSQTTLGGFDTDAYMLMITRDQRENTERAFVVCGSFLRRDGRVYLSSFAKITKEVVTKN